MPYSEIPLLRQLVEKDKEGKLSAGAIKGRKVVVWEGCECIQKVCGEVYGCNLIAHISAFLGCQYFLAFSPALGSKSISAPGSLMLVTDYMNLSGHNPLLSIPYIRSLIVANDCRFLNEPKLDPKRCFMAETLEVARKAWGELIALPDTKEAGKLCEGCCGWTGRGIHLSEAQSACFPKVGLSAIAPYLVPGMTAASAMGMKTLGIALIAGLIEEATLEFAKSAIEKCKDNSQNYINLIISSLPLQEALQQSIEAQVGFSPFEGIQEFPIGGTSISAEPAEGEIAEAHNHILKWLTSMGMKSISACYVFFNKVKYTQLVACMEVCNQMRICNIPSMPKQTRSARLGAIAAGYPLGGKSDEFCFFVCNLDSAGFSDPESHFLSRVLQRLGIPCCITIFEAESLVGKKPAVLPVSDFYSATNLTGAGGSESRLEINKIIRAALKEESEDALVFAFQGSVKPTQSEKLLAGTMKFSSFTVCSL